MLVGGSSVLKSLDQAPYVQRVTTSAQTTATNGFSVLTRRVVAEAVGTGTLVAAVVGSGMMASRLNHVLLQLLVDAIVTVAVLGVLIAVLGPVSGADFNPAVAVVDAVRRDLRPSEAARGAHERLP